MPFYKFSAVRQVIGEGDKPSNEWEINFVRVVSEINIVWVTLVREINFAWVVSEINFARVVGEINLCE